MESIKRLVIGIEHDPKVVAAARAALLYLLPLGVGALIAYVSAVTDPHWLWLATLIPLIRAVEGYALDQLHKPDQNRVNPPPVAGGGGPDLLT